jgi:hypothetical protein
MKNLGQVRQAHLPFFRGVQKYCAARLRGKHKNIVSQDTAVGA